MMHASVEAPACAMLLPTMPTYVPSVVCPLISDLRSPSVVSMTAQADDQVTLDTFVFTIATFDFIKEMSILYVNYLTYSYSV